MPQAQVGVDHSHLVRLANAAFTAVPQRVTWDNRGRRDRPRVDQPATAPHRPRTPYPQAIHHNVERLSRRRPERPDPHRLDRQRRTPALLATARTGGHRHDISHRLYRFYSWCVNAAIPKAPGSHTPSRAGGRDRSVLHDRHHQRQDQGHQPGHQERQSTSVLVPQPRQPTLPATVFLHPAITPEHSQTRGDARLNSKSPYDGSRRCC
ncbi:MAG: transposase [Kribbellaceae bacterium]|jgi:hypothetical protein|nr:transposase [Kribbellaceae bacterium]